MRTAAILASVLCVSCSLAGAAGAQDSDTDTETGEMLAALLRAGRSVVSNHQDVINDPALAEKDIDGERLVAEALAIFAKQEGAAPGADAGEQASRLAEAQIAAMREVVDEHQELIDQDGVGFKGFIPALFGRLVNERFEEKVGDEARMKVTAPPELVRNRRARPDDWELAVIEERFLGADWPKSQPFVEVVERDGRQAFRMLIPEYYSASCLTCHGQPKGEMDVTGYPKEGAAEGDLAGAISITLFR